MNNQYERYVPDPRIKSWTWVKEYYPWETEEELRQRKYQRLMKRICNG